VFEGFGLEVGNLSTLVADILDEHFVKDCVGQGRVVVVVGELQVWELWAVE
jgi:hypothetical protein